MLYNGSFSDLGKAVYNNGTRKTRNNEGTKALTIGSELIGGESKISLGSNLNKGVATLDHSKLDKKGTVTSR